METKLASIGGLVTSAMKLTWYTFVFGVKTVFKFVDLVKVHEKRPEIEENRMSQAGANEQVLQQMA